MGSAASVNILTEAFLVGNDRDELRVLCMEVNVLEGTWRMLWRVPELRFC